MALSLKETLAQARAIKGEAALNLPPAAVTSTTADPLAALQKLDVSAVGAQPQPVTEAEQAAMPEMLAKLEQTLDSPLISSALSEVLIYLHTYPETRELLRPQDIGLLVRACAKSYNATRAAKDTRSEAKARRQTKVTQAEALLADLDI